MLHFLKLISSKTKSTLFLRYFVNSL